MDQKMPKWTLKACLIISQRIHTDDDQSDSEEALPSAAEEPASDIESENDSELDVNEGPNAAEIFWVNGFVIKFDCLYFILFVHAAIFSFMNTRIEILKNL